MKKQKIIVIVGPTASGKTGLAIELSKKFSGEVISADSRQVYRGLDIGTEKVSQDEMAGIPHHLIDVVDVDHVYSADDFKHDATAAITDITNRNKIPIIAGGTFFYIDILLGKISTPEVPPDPKLREYLEDLDYEILYKKLEELDPKRAFSIDPQNKRRLVRALEIIHSLGKVPPKEEVGPPLLYNVLKIGIQVERTELRQRIRTRAQKALTRGLIEETKSLLEGNVSRDRLSEIGLEYRVVMEYLDGSLTDDQLIQKIEEKNWQYAKRQLMWLKRDESIEWFERNDSKAIVARVKEFLDD